MCIVTGERLDQDKLIRFVLNPEAEVVPDLKHRLPGRGVWVKATREAVTKAVTERRFAKAFRSKCTSSLDLPARLDALLRHEARQYMALANKAGLVVTGFEKTSEALAAGRARLLLEASDGAEDGRRKLRNRRPEGCEIIATFDSRELDLALGRANVIHAAVAHGSLAEKLLAAARRAQAFAAETAKHG
jgi:predicted RNA-binding protein YlxR (DUF448 family)